LGCFFIWNKNNDTNDAEIVVKPLASVSGFVVDSNVNPVDDFKLKISVFMKNGLVYNGSIGEQPWKAATYSDGSFDINSIPTGVPLQLAVKKPGFKTPIKLDNLTPGRNLELGEITLEPLPGFSEDTQWNCSLLGFVVDENNEPLIGAGISAAVAEERFETKTDANGWYEFKGLPNDVQMEMVSYFDGYGHNLFACTCFDPNSRLDIQIFPPAYDWYGKEAPGLFVQKWLNTEPITLEELKGRVVLLYIDVDSAKDSRFVQEVRNIYEKYRQAPFTAIAIHKRLNRWSTEKRLLEFIRQYDIKFPFGIDEKADVVEDMMLPQERFRQEGRIAVSRRGLRAEGAMCSLYEVKAHPAYYLIDKNGILRTSPTKTNLEEWIEHLLAE
jgi:peroxiredoxin